MNNTIKPFEHFRLDSTILRFYTFLLKLFPLKAGKSCKVQICELYAQIICPISCTCYNGYHFVRRKGSNSYIKPI